MHVQDDRDQFAPPRPPARLRAVVMALIAHVVLIVALTWGVNWKSSSDQPAVQAELWSAVPQQAAPRETLPPATVTPPVPVLPPTPTPPPVPQPPKPTPAPTPPPQPPPPRQAPPDTREADIAIELEKNRLEKEKKAQQQREREKERKEDERRERLEEEKKERLQKEKQDKLAQQKADQKKAEREKAERKEAELEKARDEKERQEKAEKQKQQAAQDKTKQEALEKASAKASEARRQEALRRMQGLAGASGSQTATGNAKQDSGPSGSYGGKVSAAVKPNIVYPDAVVGNPRAVVQVRAAPDGTIVGKKLVQSSGNKMWDDAVMRALDKTETLPRDIDGRVPSSLEIGFRPQD